MSKHWYSFKSKDRKVRGYCLGETEAEVARFAGYPIAELNIEKVIWDEKQFRENAVNSIKANPFSICDVLSYDIPCIEQ